MRPYRNAGQCRLQRADELLMETPGLHMVLQVLRGALGRRREAVLRQRCRVRHDACGMLGQMRGRASGAPILRPCRGLMRLRKEGEMPRRSAQESRVLNEISALAGVGPTRQRRTGPVFAREERLTPRWRAMDQ